MKRLARFTVTLHVGLDQCMLVSISEKESKKQTKTTMRTVANLACIQSTAAIQLLSYSQHMTQICTNTQKPPNIFSLSHCCSPCSFSSFAGLLSFSSFSFLQWPNPTRIDRLKKTHHTSHHRTHYAIDLSCQTNAPLDGLFPRFSFIDSIVTNLPLFFSPFFEDFEVLQKSRFLKKSNVTLF